MVSDKMIKLAKEAADYESKHPDHDDSPAIKGMKMALKAGNVFTRH